MFQRQGSLNRLAARRTAPAAPRKVEDALLSVGFVPRSYRLAHPDLDAALADDESALAHFIAYCGVDRRPFPIELVSSNLRRIAELNCPRTVRADMLMTLVNSFVVPPSALWHRDRDDQRRFWDDVISAACQVGDPMMIVGDSHSNGYVQVMTRLLTPVIPFHVLFTGCSAAGLANPLSRTGASLRLQNLAAALPSWLPIYLKFGQVDVEFVFNFKRIETSKWEFSETDYKNFCRDTVDTYVSFLQQHFRSCSRTVLSVFPPALSDIEWRKGYVNAQVVAEAQRDLHSVNAGLRKIWIPTLGERTRQHLYFNDLLREKVEKSGFHFLSDFEIFLSEDGTLDGKFTPSTRGRDHHLELDPIKPMLRRLILDDLLDLGPWRDPSR